MPYPGEVIADTYQIINEIGAGGAGVIYKAYHLNLQKYVVVKKIKDHFVGVLNSRGEADILKSLHHTCLPQVYDFVQLGNEVFTVMDFIEGHDLKYFIDQHYRFEEESLKFWLMQLLEVLDYLHKHGILHLDIKPANIMLTPEGNICLIDFNISFDGEGDSMTGISEIYASPEQYRKWIGTLYHTKDQDIILDARTDIYSLGATFYHMMTGYAPASDLAKMIPISSFQLNYSTMLIEIINRMLQPDKRRRFATVEKELNVIRRLERTKEEKNTLRAVFVIMLAALAALGIAFGIIVSKNHSTSMNSGRELAMSTAENYALQGNYEKALSLYKELYEEKEDDVILRKMAATSLEAALDVSAEDEKASLYLKDAIENYEALNQRNAAAYTDQMNLVIAYMEAERDDEAKVLLDRMKETYPEQYKIYVYLATIAYNTEMKKTASNRDFSEVKALVEKAGNLADDGTEDAQLQKLIEAVGE